MTTPILNDKLVSAMTPVFRRLNNPGHSFADCVAMMQLIPGLRGLWPMSSVATDDTIDLSGQGRDLTNNNTALYGYTDLRPYVHFNGSTQYLSRADETGLDVIGNEAYIDTSVQGLTAMGWFRFDVTAAAVEVVMAKDSGSGQISWRLDRIATGEARVVISTDGTAIFTQNSTDTLSATTWYHLVIRFDPLTELAIFVNGVSDVNTASIPATLHNSTSAFTIGARGTPANYFDGQASLCALSSMYLSDTLIQTIFDFQRPLFGV